MDSCPIKYRVQRERSAASMRLARAEKRGDKAMMVIERRLVSALSAFVAQLAD